MILSPHSAPAILRGLLRSGRCEVDEVENLRRDLEKMEMGLITGHQGHEYSPFYSSYPSP